MNLHTMNRQDIVENLAVDIALSWMNIEYDTTFYDFYLDLDWDNGHLLNEMYLEAYAIAATATE